MNLLFLILVLFSQGAVIVNEPLIVQKPLQEIDINDKDNAGIKLVQDIVDSCLDIKINDSDFKSNKLDKEGHEKINKEYFEKMNLKFDFFKVSNDSLKYDFDIKTKKFKKHHWDGKTQADKDKFVNEFTDLLSTIVYPICGNFFGTKKIIHSVMASKNDSIQIKTKVFLKKKYVLAEWFIGNSNGVFKVYDVSIEGESWVESFRSQFTEVINKKSYNELFDIMAKKKKEVLDKRAKKSIKEPLKTSEADDSKVSDKPIVPNPPIKDSKTKKK